MDQIQNGGILIETVAIESADQETFGAGSIANRLTSIHADQVRERLVELLRSVQDAFAEVSAVGDWQAKEIRVKVGVDVEGRFFVASGKASTAIEVMFSVR
jgi:hypothetical protein